LGHLGHLGHLCQDLVPLILGARANQDARDGDGWTESEA
jgi:hypothetical protein